MSLETFKQMQSEIDAKDAEILQLKHDIEDIITFIVAITTAVGIDFNDAAKMEKLAKNPMAFIVKTVSSKIALSDDEDGFGGVDFNKMIPIYMKYKHLIDG